jgi:uncharacterized membrane protein YkvI
MRKTTQILQVAFTYIGTIVGAGFASGQEILQFFTRYGWLASFTIAISTVIFIVLGIKLMLLAHEVGAQSYEDLNKVLFGTKIGEVISLFTLVILFGVTTIMLAGAGSLFVEYLHLSFQTGLILTLIAAYYVISKGIHAIMVVNSLVVPFMLTFTAVIVCFTWQLPNANHWLRLTSDYPNYSVWFSPILYTAFNLALAQAVLVPLGAAIKDRSTLYWGGWIGGCGIGLMLWAGHFALSAQMPGITQFQIPMGQIIRPLGTGVQLIYIVVIYGEIFTTFIADAYGLTLQIEQRTHWNRKSIILTILALSYSVSQIGFSKLLTTLYPLFGLVSLIWFVMMIWRRNAWRT